MKYIKSFESYSINETLGDMMTMPVDPIKGSAEVYSDIVDSIKNKISEITSHLKKASREEVMVIRDFLKKTFGTTMPEFTKENAKKLSDALGLDNIDRIEENFKENENIAVKICGKIKQALGINIHAWAWIPISIVLGGVFELGIFAVAIASWALLFIFSKIMEIFGYTQNNIDGIGQYDPSKDIRNRMSGVRSLTTYS